jgi:hypothetical protein
VIGSSYKLTYYIMNWSSETSIGLLVACGAYRAFGMIKPIIMVVKGFNKIGKQDEGYE